MGKVNITLKPRTSFAWLDANLGLNQERRAAIFARFWSHVTRTDAKACWIYAGYIGTHGYGVFGIGGKSTGKQLRVRAHRFAWLASRGDIPAGYVVCHRCDTPACVNPSHLYLARQAENIHDSVRKGRKHGWRVKQKLKAADVIEIRARVAAGELHRLVARDFGIARNTVTGIVTGQTWAHLAESA